MKRLIYLIGVAAFFCFVFSPINVKAFAISPLKYHVTLDAGAVNHKITITVKNEEKEKNFYYLSVLGAKQLDDGRLTYGSEYSVAENWVRPEINAIELNPEEEKNVNFYINIPQTAKSGSHYLGLAVSMSSPEQKNDIGISGKLISILLLQVAGLVDETANVKSWLLNKKSLNGKLESFVEIENISTVGLPISGHVDIRNYFGTTVFSQALDIDGTILPRTIRKSIDNINLPTGFYWPGPYSVELNINYGLTQQKILLAKPIWLIHYYYFLIAIIIFCYIVYKIARRKK